MYEIAGLASAFDLLAQSLFNNHSVIAPEMSHCLKGAILRVVCCSMQMQNGRCMIASTAVLAAAGQSTDAQLAAPIQPYSWRLRAAGKYVYKLPTSNGSMAIGPRPMSEVQLGSVAHAT